MDWSIVPHAWGTMEQNNALLKTVVIFFCSIQLSCFSTGVFRKAAQSLVRPWALILRGRLYGANI